MNAGSPLLPVAEALARVLASAPVPLEAEEMPIAQARGRTLAADLAARRTQPPSDVSAMDGYALRAADIASVPVELTLVGESVAGRGFVGSVGPGQAVRILTGAPVPAGADTVLIQENTTRDGDRLTALQSDPVGRNIRRAGLDFAAGSVQLRAGRRLGPSELALAAAMDYPSLPVVRRPRVAILASGDELVRPGEPIGPDQIVASNTYAVAAYAEAAGAETIDLGIAADEYPALEERIRAALDAKADVLVTVGGASVGDRDLVQTALSREGMALDFWKIAMRPGKPLMHGQIGDMRILGLPGNPVSAIVCGILFLVPLVRALQGDPHAGADPSEAAVLGAPMKENDNRADYVRAALVAGGDGLPVATAFPRQDSSMLSILAEAECLILRQPFAPAAAAGDPCRIVRLR